MHSLRQQLQAKDLDCNKAAEGEEEAINSIFCPFQEIYHTVVLQGVRNISDTP